MSPREAVRSLVYFDKVDNSHLAPFDHSGIHDPGLEPFPESRPAATDRAKATGESMGVRVKASGNRPLQPATNKFFYWLRASALETNRVAYWWANRMLTSNAPLQEKMALFWHGHFANNEDKVRDYRKLLNQLELFQTKGTGNFRDLVVAVAQDPAMLCFLDAGKNIKGAPNENFAREIMELFTMGVGNYTEKDVREAARAFTGWNYVDTKFVVNADQHDAAPKTFLGKNRQFRRRPDHRHHHGTAGHRRVPRRETLPAFSYARIWSRRRKLHSATSCAGTSYEIAPFLETLFLSKDFYSDASIGAQIQGPVQLAVSTCKKLDLKAIPGVPDFNAATGALGQRSVRAAHRGRLGPGAKLDHARAFCSNAATSRATCCFRTSTSSRQIATTSRPTFARYHNASVTAPTSPRPPAKLKASLSPSPTWRPIATKISTPATPAIVAGRWRSNA